MGEKFWGHFASVCAFAMTLLVSAPLFAMDISQCQIGQQHLNAQRLQKAVDSYTRCINFGNLNTQVKALAYTDRGVALRRSGQLDAAIKDLTFALQLNPRNADALAERGIALSLKNDLSAAIADYSAAAAINPKLIKAVLNRGYVYEALGQIDSALLDFRAAYALGVREKPLMDMLAKYDKKGSPDSVYEASFNLPDHFKLAFKNDDGRTKIYQYVPKQETLQNWKRMFTIMVVKLERPMPGLEEQITKKTVLDFIQKCGAAQSDRIEFPRGNVPSYASAGYCDNVDKSKIPDHIHVLENGFILAKSYTAEQVVYMFQYEWQSDAQPSSYVKSSGMLESEIMPIMTDAVVTLVKAGK